MPFVSIRLAGTASKQQKAEIVADVTRSLVERLGKTFSRSSRQPISASGIAVPTPA